MAEDLINIGTLKYLWNNNDLHLSQIWLDSPLGLFYDLLHLVKCDRYRKSKPKETCVWPSSEEATIEPDLFIQKGIPKECFIDSKASKMHDDIPLKLFTPENCHLLFQQKEYDLCLSLLPSTYIIEAVMNESISRELRLNYLTIGFCIVSLYYDGALRYLNTDLQSHSDSSKCYTLFNLDYCIKYMALAWSLSKEITDLRCVRLGSLGTHLLEHFFGSNRRINHGIQIVELIMEMTLQITFKEQSNFNYYLL